MEQIVWVPTEKLLPNPYQPRKHFKSEDMLSLADSIKQNGVLQPLLCRQINNSDYYELVSGERRLRASILANLQAVPCLIIECDYESSAVFSIIENIQRSDLNFFEEAQAINQLITQFGMTQEQVAKKLGKNQSTLSNKLRLLRLPVDVRYFIEKEGLTERHARALLKLETEKQMWTTLKAITEKKLNVEQTENYILSMLDTKIKPRKTTPKVYRDVRIFVNTFNKAIKAMKDSGIDAKTNKTETEEYIEYLVRIPKNVQECTKTA